MAREFEPVRGWLSLAGLLLLAGVVSRMEDSTHRSKP